MFKFQTPSRRARLRTTSRAKLTEATTSDLQYFTVAFCLSTSTSASSWTLDPITSRQRTGIPSKFEVSKSPTCLSSIHTFAPVTLTGPALKILSLLECGCILRPPPHTFAAFDAKPMKMKLKVLTGKKVARTVTEAVRKKRDR